MTVPQRFFAARWFASFGKYLEQFLVDLRIAHTHPIAHVVRHGATVIDAHVDCGWRQENFRLYVIVVG